VFLSAGEIADRIRAYLNSRREKAEPPTAQPEPQVVPGTPAPPEGGDDDALEDDAPQAA
jgi:hypothetical protein